jgi:hypothetical protein
VTAGRVSAEQRLAAGIVAALTGGAIALAAASGLSALWLAVTALVLTMAAAAIGFAITATTAHGRVIGLAAVNVCAFAAICAVAAYAWTTGHSDTPTARIIAPAPGPHERWSEFRGTVSNLPSDAELWLMEDYGIGFEALAPVNQYPDGRWVATKNELSGDRRPPKYGTVEVALVWTSDAGTERRFYDNWTWGVNELNGESLRQHILAHARYRRARRAR